MLALGTALIAVGYGLAGLTGSLYGVIAGLLLAGLGGSTQHPIASSLVVGAYPGLRSRTALGTYNFTGDVGKVLLPARVRADRRRARLAAGADRDRRHRRRSAPA